MSVNNNFDSFDRDDLRDDDQDFENTRSDYSGKYSHNDDGFEDDIDKEDESAIKDTYPDKSKKKQGNEISGKNKSEKDSAVFPRETEYNQPERSSDASMSEQVDVTPPNAHEFPSVGNAETDFVSRPYRRRTGRMVGHEPGTESI